MIRVSISWARRRRARWSTRQRAAAWFLVVYFAGMAAIVWSAGAKAGEDYDRAAFGSWLDLDGDGLNARDQAIVANVGAWVGVWGLYTGVVLDDPRLIDVDHVVPLRWAWDRGASEWDMARRQEFANDPANLVPVHRSANRSKGARGPADWMPQNIAAWGVYLDRFERVVAKYGLDTSWRDRRGIACARRIAAGHAIGVKVRRVRWCW